MLDALGGRRQAERVYPAPTHNCLPANLETRAVLVPMNLLALTLYTSSGATVELTNMTGSYRANIMKRWTGVSFWKGS